MSCSEYLLNSYNNVKLLDNLVSFSGKMGTFSGEATLFIFASLLNLKKVHSSKKEIAYPGANSLKSRPILEG